MKTWKVVGSLLVFWLLFMVYVSNLVFQPSDGNNTVDVELKRALRELDRLKAQNNEFRSLADEIKHLKIKSSSPQGDDIKEIEDHLNKVSSELQRVSSQVGVPSLNHELKRRKSENDAVELWYYLRSQLKILKVEANGKKDVVGRITNLLERGANYQRTLLNDMLSLKNTDGTDDWRGKESQELGEIVQRRLQYLQNPKDCSKAKKVVCKLSKGCGYGCQLHHVTYCLMIGYATQRTLILESKGWSYAHGGWETVFKPLSDTCTDRKGSSSKYWGAPDKIKNIQVVDLPIVDSLHPKPDYLPLAIPKDLSERLIRLHGDPSVWWIGQFVKYLTRPQSHLQDDMDRAKHSLGFKNPIVGVHVRRTDKVGTEAAFHGIEEYMIYVEEYFDRLEAQQGDVTRRVFLASDDPKVLADAKQKFPHYEFVSDPQITKTASLRKRYSDTSLHGVIMDIHFLSQSDYLVCTFSSQVCRVAYELMQTMHGDASTYFKSLDDIYYFGGQNAHNMEAVESHIPGNSWGEIELQPGDLVGIAGNHWDGYSKGHNRRTGKTGLFPSYKVKNKLVIVDLPTYSEADKNR